MQGLYRYEIVSFCKGPKTQMLGLQGPSTIEIIVFLP